jgi:hypothetical protein
VRLKAALVGQVVDGQAAAGIGVHTVWPAQHNINAANEAFVVKQSPINARSSLKPCTFDLL